MCEVIKGASSTYTVSVQLILTKEFCLKVKLHFILFT